MHHLVVAKVRRDPALFGRVLATLAYAAALLSLAVWTLNRKQFA